MFPDVQRLPLIPGKVALVDITQQTKQYHYIVSKTLGEVLFFSQTWTKVQMICRSEQ